LSLTVFEFLNVYLPHMEVAYLVMFKKTNTIFYEKK